MFPQLVFSIFLTVCPLLLTAEAARPVRAPAHRGREVVTRVHGTRLTLSIPRGPYVRRELVETTVRLDNMSSRAISVARGCDAPNPGVEVRTAEGRAVYPPVFPDGPPQDCGYLPPLRLAPGRSLTSHEYILLLGTRLRAVASFSGLRPTGPPYIAGADLTVALRAAPSPAIKMHRGSRWSVDITPNGRVSGPLLFADWCRCDRRGGGYSGHLQWIAAPSRHLVPIPNPGCRAVIEWHIEAGWLGHAVGYVSIVRP